MIDPTLNLAFGIHSNPGVYALLLGSGISRSAGILTGWEITLGLIRQLIEMEEADGEPDPETWYVEKTGQQPDYSVLLEELARTPAERQRILKSYFEPTEEEREEGKKLPTIAHKAIAAMMAAGQIRVVITTNFDRLLEDALTELGVTATVIRTSDDIRGAPPLSQTERLIIKVHGDYLDNRIKNSPKELRSYHKDMDGLLDRVLDEFGLVVCGWSADWDEALRKAFARCPNRRYTLYWAARGEPGKHAQDLINLRSGQLLQIEGADTFFQELKEKVWALKEIDRPHPLSAKVAVARLKRYMQRQEDIYVHDLVMEESSRALKALEKDEWGYSSPWSTEEFMRRVNLIEAQTEVLRPLLAAGCYFGRPEHLSLWSSSLRLMLQFNTSESGLIIWSSLRKYPALLILYSCGVAALANGRLDVLANLFNEVKITNVGREQCAPEFLSGYDVMELAAQKNITGKENHKTPLSDHLFELLRGDMAALIHDAAEYRRHFYFFEVYLGLIGAFHEERETGYFRGHFGRFVWDWAWTPGRVGPERLALERLGVLQEEAPDTFKSLFGGYEVDFDEVSRKWFEFIGRVRGQMDFY